ncbi:hypothetical protein EDB86DRAFT_1189475 [Lactarius hatsudake]|nr:hypothetical protein EDB86DRAFT_1189475 [Lactarius hatsudake]
MSFGPDLQDDHTVKRGKQWTECHVLGSKRGFAIQINLYLRGRKVSGYISSMREVEWGARRGGQSGQNWSQSKCCEPRSHNHTPIGKLAPNELSWIHTDSTGHRRRAFTGLVLIHSLGPTRFTVFRRRFTSSLTLFRAGARRLVPSQPKSSPFLSWFSCPAPIICSRSGIPARTPLSRCGRPSASWDHSPLGFSSTGSVMSQRHLCFVCCCIFEPCSRGCLVKVHLFPHPLLAPTSRSLRWPCACVAPPFQAFAVA